MKGRRSGGCWETTVGGQYFRTATRWHHLFMLLVQEKRPCIQLASGERLFGG